MYSFVLTPVLPSRRRGTSTCAVRARPRAVPCACAASARQHPAAEPQPPILSRTDADARTPAPAPASGESAGPATPAAASAQADYEASTASEGGKEPDTSTATSGGPGNSLSYSVGVTIVCGPNAALRRKVINGLFAQSVGAISVVSAEPSQSSHDLQVDAAPVPNSTEELATNSGENPTLSAVSGEHAEESPNAAAMSVSDDPTNRDAVDGLASRGGNSIDAEPASDDVKGVKRGGFLDDESDMESGPDVQSPWFYVPSTDGMFDQVASLAAGRDCESIIVDCPITASSRELASEIRLRGNAALRIDCIVCVIDSARVLDDLELRKHPGSDSGGETTLQSVGDDSAAALKVPGRPGSSSSAECHAMVVVSCVEDANVIAVTSTSEFEPVQNVLSALNLAAAIIPFEDERPVPLSSVVNTNLYNPDTVALNATWRRVLLASRGNDPKLAKSVPKAAKDVTFLYQAKRPFHPTRFYDHIKDMATFTGVFRSTGRIWLPTRMDAPLEWEQAGDSATLRAGKPFYASMPESEWGVSDSARDLIMKGWDTQYGDRNTEMVFVGVGFDKNRLQGLLDECLLQDEEMVFNNLWENFNDPFKQWVPLDADESDDEDQVIRSSSVASPSLSSSSQASSNAADASSRDSPEETEPTEEKIDQPSAAGILDSSELDDETLERASALDVLELGISDGGEEYSRYSQPADDGAYDEDDVVVSSWEGSVADGILQQMPKVGLPVTLVTGFLGSGKTTLLNYILTAEHGLRIAVLVNEFGEVDIDNQIIEKGDWSSNDEVLELANGCICCSINDSFVSAVKTILEKKDMVDYLIIETTGVADPVPVINSLMVSDIAEQIRVDGILTLVDAENFDGSHMSSATARAQILAADTILLSKTDIAPPERIENAVAYIKKMRPAARILKSQRGRIPVNMILDVGIRIGDSPAHLRPVKEDSLGGSSEDDFDDPSHDHSHSHAHEEAVSDGHSSSHGHDHGHDGHDHEHGSDCSSECTDPTHNHEHVSDCGPECNDPTHNHERPNHLEVDGFSSMSFKSDRPIVPELFMDNFLQTLPEGVFRAKGLLHFDGYEPRYVFNLSGRRYDFIEDDWPEGVAPGNQLVVIGRDLDIESLRKTLEECHAPSSESQLVSSGEEPAEEGLSKDLSS